MRRRKEKCKNKPGDHENQECDVRSIIDRLFGTVPVLTDRDRGSDDCVKIENSPKDTDISTLLTLHRI